MRPLKSNLRRLILLGFAAGLTLLACSKKTSSAKKSETEAKATSEFKFEKPLTPQSSLVIGSPILAGSKTMTAAEIEANNDPALAVFQSDLHPKLKQYCAGGCHDQNQKPFASDAVSLAYETAKPYLKANAEESQMIINIRNAHNNTNPAWEAEIAPAIETVAGAMVSP